MSTADIPAIDVHGHYGICKNDCEHHMIEKFRTGSIDEVCTHAKNANVEKTIVSPLQGLFPRGYGDPVGGNIDAHDSTFKRTQVYQYVILDPLAPETYRQTEEMLKQDHCLGIKIHPEEHKYAIADHGDKLFEFIASLGATVLTHSGEENSLPMDYVQYLNRYPEVSLILAHCGMGHDGDPSHQVRAIQASKHGNVYTDTSSAINVTPNLMEWYVSEVGADKVMFGSDSPLYHAAMMRSRVDYSDICETDKLKILRENALKLFFNEEAKVKLVETETQSITATV